MAGCEQSSTANTRSLMHVLASSVSCGGCLLVGQVVAAVDGLVAS